MCAMKAREVREKLLSAGLSGETPFSSIRWGTTSSQEVISGRLEDLGERTVAPPCLTVVGNVVEFRERLSWFERKPLFGRTVLVVRPKDEALKLAEELRTYGARALIFPAIKFVPTNPRADLLEDVLDTDWLIFTSKRGVRFFVHVLRRFGLDVRAIKSHIAAVGEGTAQELSGYGIAADLIPEKASAAGLLEEFRKMGIGGEKMAILRGGLKNEALRSGLEGLGAYVVEMTLYRTVPAGEREAQILGPLLPEVDAFIFTSPSGVDSFLRAFGAKGRKVLKGGFIVAMGPTTGRYLEEKGFRVDVMPIAPTNEGIIEAVLMTIRQNGHRRSPLTSNPESAPDRITSWPQKEAPKHRGIFYRGGLDVSQNPDEEAEEEW
jgi:uroporphyrinogen III methyltransferase/synthase